MGRRASPTLEKHACEGHLVHVEDGHALVLIVEKRRRVSKTF